MLRQIRLRAPGQVLDLGCGHGFHSQRFADLGFSVTGFDPSKDYVQRARKLAKIAKKTARFVHGEMRNHKRSFAPSSFDVVVSLENSFGLADRRSDDLKMLREANRVVKPGGWFVINALNERGVLHHLKQPVSTAYYEPLPNVFVINEAFYDRDARTAVHRCTMAHFKDGKARLFREDFRQNVYSHRELKDLLRRAGFRIEKTWGVLAGGRFDPRKSWYQTIAARKLLHAK